MFKHEDDIEKNLSVGSVGIIGCGWLGKALATSLLEKGVPVLATSSKLDNVERLNQQLIIAQQLMLPTDNTKLAQHDVFTKQNLVIAITPQFKQGRTDYADKIAQLVNAAQQRGLVQHIILLSSTAVYHGLTGNVDEESSLNMATEKVQILNAAEQTVLHFPEQRAKQGSKQGTVIRLAGLVGPERHPGKFLLANKILSNSATPVNLIHQQDAVGLIESLLQVKSLQGYSQQYLHGSSQGIFNGVSDTHVSKKEYYQVAAKALNLTSPLFTPENAPQSINETTRVVSGEKAKKDLNYKFVYPNLLAWL